METMEDSTYSPTNKQSVLSLIFGILTILFFCIGWIPLPFTGFICFPLGILFGILALIFGIISLNQIRRHNHSGRPMAWTGIVIGALVFVCLLCMLIAIISLFIISPDSIQMPPFLDKYQI
jgi:energy-coupling factor transporter transmembrane protein EcfT